jgi:hypothetical protein
MALARYRAADGLATSDRKVLASRRGEGHSHIAGVRRRRFDQVPDHDALLRAYMEVAQRSWSDEEFRRRLTDAPNEALAEAGWALPEGTAVTVKFFDPDAPGDELLPLEELTEAWANGIDAGDLRIQVPERPPTQLGSAEISEEQLTSASGGNCLTPGVCCGLCHRGPF